MRLPAFEHKRARIEIVPMIDTIFFLLVYFMIASLTMSQMEARRVTLPVSVTADRRPEAQVIVTVDKTGRCYLGRTEIDEMQIKPALQARLQARPGMTVLINCDRDQPVARFAEVFDLVKQANPTTVMLATAPRDDAAAQP